MKKSGFTLIELLGTVLILSAIILVIAPVTLNWINKGEESTSEVSENLIVMAGKNWASDNKDKLPTDKGGISVLALEKEGYVSESNKNGCIFINNENGVYYYNYSESDECKTYALADPTPPEIVSLTTTSTTNSITIEVATKEDESTIEHYEVQIGNNTAQIVNTSAEEFSYTFENLTDNTINDIKVVAVNAFDEASTEATTAKTELLTAPTLTRLSNNGRINFNNDCSEETICSYKVGGGEFVTASYNKDVYFSEPGTLVAKVTDGTNTAVASLTLTL